MMRHHTHLWLFAPYVHEGLLYLTTQSARRAVFMAMLHHTGELATFATLLASDDVIASITTNMKSACTASQTVVLKLRFVMDILSLSVVLCVCVNVPPL